MITWTRRSRLLAGGVGLVIAVTPLVASFDRAAVDAPRLLAGCDDTVDTTDSFSMNCSPTMIPDMSDQLTEAEVAEPGWNAHSGGGH